MPWRQEPSSEANERASLGREDGLVRGGVGQAMTLNERVKLERRVLQGRLATTWREAPFEPYPLVAVLVDLDRDGQWVADYDLGPHGHRTAMVWPHGDQLHLEFI